MIKNRDIRNALESLAEEVGYQEQQLHEAEAAEDKLREKVDELELEVEELKIKIKELEEALVEAHLTSTEGSLR